MNLIFKMKSIKDKIAKIAASGFTDGIPDPIYIQSELDKLWTNKIISGYVLNIRPTFVSGQVSYISRKKINYLDFSMTP